MVLNIGTCSTVVAWCLLAGPRLVHWDLLHFRLSSLIDAAAGACSRPVLLPPFRIRATGAGARWSWIPPSWLVALQQVRTFAYGTLGLPGGAGRRLLPAPYALVLVARALTGGLPPVDGTRPTRPPARPQRRRLALSRAANAPALPAAAWEPW